MALTLNYKPDSCSPCPTGNNRHAPQAPIHQTPAAPHLYTSGRRIGVLLTTCLACRSTRPLPRCGTPPWHFLFRIHRPKRSSTGSEVSHEADLPLDRRVASRAFRRWSLARVPEPLLLTPFLQTQRFPLASRSQYRIARSISFPGCARSARAISLDAGNAGIAPSLSPIFIR